MAAVRSTALLPAANELTSDKRAGARLDDRRSARRVPARDGRAQKRQPASFSYGLVLGKIRFPLLEERAHALHPIMGFEGHFLRGSLRPQLFLQGVVARRRMQGTN